MERRSRHRVFLYGVVRLSFLAASLLDDAQQLAEFVFANNPGCSFRNAKSGELLDLAKWHGVCLRRRFGQQFNAELAAGARWVATPMRLAELMDSGGHGLEQAFGLNIDLVHNPFDVAIFDLAERHWKRIAFRLLFALRNCAPYRLNCGYCKTIKFIKSNSSKPYTLGRLQLSQT